MSNDFENDEPTVKIPRETMWQARERSKPAHIAWGADAAHDEGFRPIGPTQVTRPMRASEPPVFDVSDTAQEHTHVDGVPEPIDSGDDTEPLYLHARVAS